MPDQQLPPQEILRALNLADGYLSEAQDVLWNTSPEFSGDARNQQLEELTEEIWTLQSQIYDLQQELEK